MGGVEEAAMHRPCPGARAPMQEEHGLATRIAHLLPIHDMPFAKRQGPVSKGAISEEIARGIRGESSRSSGEDFFTIGQTAARLKGLAARRASHFT